MSDAAVVGHLEEQWARLLQELRARYVVAEPAPGRLVVSASGRHQPPLHVEVVMTPAEFDDIVAIPTGSFEGALGAVLYALREHPAQAPYLVYETYDLVPSQTPVPPPDDEWP